MQDLQTVETKVHGSFLCKQRDLSFITHQLIASARIIAYLPVKCTGRKTPD